MDGNLKRDETQVFESRGALAVGSRFSLFPEPQREVSAGEAAPLSFVFAFSTPA